jgi:dihydroorotate dehydrogenase electron transfer subunit
MEIKRMFIANVEKLEKNHYWLTLTGRFKEKPSPGQFLQIKIDPLFLRRPFSIGSYKSGKTGLLVQIKGKGTDILTKENKGSKISVTGPLGEGFPYHKTWKKIWFIGGGTGIAPLLFLYESLKHKHKLCHCEFFYGARRKNLLFFDILPRKLTFEFSTGDGSYGEKGEVTELVRKRLRSEKPDVIYAGGPEGLLKEISLISAAFKIPAYITLENKMACGMGLCYGCVAKIKTTSGGEYKRVCKEGPVFNANKVKWE